MCLKTAPTVVEGLHGYVVCCRRCVRYAKQAALDPWLQRTAAIGLALSLLVTFLGAANVPIIVTLWMLYHTLVNVGQHW